MEYNVVVVAILACVVFNEVSCIFLNEDWHFSGENIALGKTATQLPYTYETYSADKAVDGNDDNDVNHGSCSHTSGTSVSNDSHDAQWMVDLIDNFYVTGIIIINRKLEYWRNRLKYFEVLGFSSTACTGGKHWCSLYKDVNNNNQMYSKEIIKIKLNGFRAYSKISIILPKLPYFVNKGMSYLTLCEVKIYAVNCTYIAIPDGVMSPNNLYFGVNEKASVLCNEGFQPKTQEITCSETGEWTRYEACSRIKCSYPEKPENGYYIMEPFSNGQIFSSSSSLAFGSIISIKCDIGYEITDNASRRCQRNGTWSGIRSQGCEKKLCSFPGNISNGEYHFKDGSLYSTGNSFYNTTVIVTCKTGFEIHGSNERTCTDNKTWGTESACQLIKCDFPEKPQNGFYAAKGKDGTLIPVMGGQSSYQDTLYKVCPKGSVLISESKTRQCLETKSWSEEPGQCFLITCKELGELKNGQYNYTDDPFTQGYPLDTVVTAECNEPFRLSNSGNKSRRCTERGDWDNEPAVCISVTTDKMEQDNHIALISGLSSALVVIVVSIALAAFFIYRRRKKRDVNREKPNKYANLMLSDFAVTRTPDIQDGDYAEIPAANITSATGSSRKSTKVKSKPADDAMYSIAVDGKSMKPSCASSTSLQSQSYYSFTNIVKIPNTGILVKDLSENVLNGDVANDRFLKEFQSLPHGMVEPHKEALKKMNIGKNRYRNLYAYDGTRVVLETDDKLQSDYINACYVHGFKKPKQYIASQGPTKDILIDFWRMIWQSKTCKIVMLTNLVEEEKTKCEQYWPEEDASCEYGSISVHTEKTENFSQFVTRRFLVRKKNSKQQHRTVTQFHFTSWPDKGVPKYTSSLVHFISKVKNAREFGEGPIIVHCSAGVGRTGTFIALDYLTEQGKELGYVDVIGTVTALRRQRVNLVQTQEQYVFVYHALVESLMLPSSALPAVQFPDVYQELLQIDMEKKKRKICVEFETLKKVSPVSEECQYVSSKLVRNRQKNRYSNVLPVEEFMPSLMSDGYNDDSRYINAVFLPTYREKNAFIVTQTPLESTIEDFWGLVWEHDVHTIVMMNNLRETKDSEIYWPHKDETIVFANIEIKNDDVEEINGHRIVSFLVRKYKVTRKVKQIRCGGWPSGHSLPESPDVILNLMKIVQTSQQQSGNHTVLVHCMNGADKSGLYCVISAVIERMKIEQAVAISQVIEEMRNAREQIIPTVEQYKFCHEAVLAYLQQNETYSNFTA